MLKKLTDILYIFLRYIFLKYLSFEHLILLVNIMVDCFHCYTVILLMGTSSFMQIICYSLAFLKMSLKGLISSQVGLVEGDSLMEALNLSVETSTGEFSS